MIHPSTETASHKISHILILNSVMQFSRVVPVAVQPFCIMISNSGCTTGYEELNMRICMCFCLLVVVLGSFVFVFCFLFK